MRIAGLLIPMLTLSVWLIGVGVQIMTGRLEGWPLVGGLALIATTIPAWVALRIMQRFRTRPAVERVVAVLLAVGCRMGISLGLAVTIFMLGRDGTIGEHPRMFWGTMLGSYVLLMVAETGIFLRDTSADLPEASR